MKKILYVLALSLILMSCEDFLQREPQDFGPETAFFKDVSDVEYAANTYYDLLPKVGAWAGGIYNEDENSDNQAGFSPKSLFYKGDKRPLNTGSDDCPWKFKNLRGINYSLNEVNKRLAENSITGARAKINHFLGELYFFRAYDHFRLLESIGDAPILTETPTEDFAQLVKESKRRPRNEVARFILEDLQRASNLMSLKAPAEGRLSKHAALLLRARVALFEATWLKYHANTPFVPDYPNSPYVKKWGPYTYPSGSIENESNFFFDVAIACADSVASQRTLDKDYQTLFNNISGSFLGQEVIMARYYIKGINGHNLGILARVPAGTGYTYDLVKSFLLLSGKPIYANIASDDTLKYMGDKYTIDEMRHRDQRLQMSLKSSGKITLSIGEGIDSTFVRTPPILASGNDGSPTGYEILKYVSNEPGQEISAGGTSATIIFRAAEARLIYLEAYYERNHNLAEKCDQYWRELRKRAGFVDTDYNVTITNTDLSKEHDLGKYSGKDKLVDKTLYNIRRERRCEFIAEGKRLSDLKRWRSLDNMQDYIVKGFNLWDKLYKEYGVSLEAGKNVSINSPSEGPYIQPFGIVSSNSAYLGYNFQIAHYLEPLPVGEFRLTATNGDISTSPLHQNPGWSDQTVGPAADNSDPSLR